MVKTTLKEHLLYRFFPFNTYKNVSSISVGVQIKQTGDLVLVCELIGVGRCITELWKGSPVLTKSQSLDPENNST